MSTLLIVTVLTVPMTLALMDAPEWLGIALSFPFALFLVVLSHFRMIDAGISPGWVLLMVFVINIGPSVDLPGITLYLSNLVHLVPVAIGWIIPTRFNSSEKVHGEVRDSESSGRASAVE